MKEKMQWDPKAPYEYNFSRGLYYHHIIQDELLCGSQPTGPNDIQYLAEAEKVNTVVSVRSMRNIAISRSGVEDCNSFNIFWNLLQS
jgi:hypothetical protein